MSNTLAEECGRLEALNRELLEACKMALAQIRQDNDERDVLSKFRGTEHQVKAAIARAERKAQ